MKKIKLTKEQFAIIDDEDFEFINQWKWYFGCDGYASRTQYIKGSGRKHEKNNIVRMHRLIMNCPKNKFIDHKNHNRLDNRKINLRIVTTQQNAWNISIPKHNTSGLLGVSWCKDRNKWQSHIKFNGKSIYLGLFIDKDEAHKAYLQAKERYHNI